MPLESLPEKIFDKDPTPDQINEAIGLGQRYIKKNYLNGTYVWLLKKKSGCNCK